LKEIPYVQTSSSEIFRRSKNESSLLQARELVEKCVHHYNENRLHSAIGYVTPRDKLEGREKMIFPQRDNILEEARQKRMKKGNNKIAA